MALALGKVTIIIGAGILGSVLAREGGSSNVSDWVSGAFKIAWKQIHRENSAPASGKPRNDILVAQVKDLQKQLKELVNDRSPITIYTGSRSGLKIYGGPVFGVVVVGLGCMWWRGWKFSDFMFVTRRGFSDACASVGKQLDQVSSSVSSAKRHLSSRIDRVDANLDECAELTAGTKDEVSQLRGDMRVFSVDVESVHRAVQTLETKIGRIEEKQDFTSRGVHALCEFVHNVENNRVARSIQASPSSVSRPALEHSGVTPSRTISLPPKSLALESPSPSPTNETAKVHRKLQGTFSDSGLKVLDGIISEVSLSSEAEEPKSNGTSSSSSRFGWKFPSLNPSFLSRTSSVNLPPYGR